MSANNTATPMRHHPHPHPHQHQHQHQEAASMATSRTSLQGGNGASLSGGGAIIYNGKGSSAGVFDASTASFPRYQPNLHGMPLDWTPEEQVILDEGLIRYASESNLARYAKIAMHLDNKTIRDVALRCRWMTKRDFSKRRKEDFNLSRKSKDRKEKTPDPSAMSSHGVMAATFPSYGQGGQGVVSNINDDGFSYNGTSGVTWQQLQQNIQAFEQISSNLANHQIHENIGLLCRARENILQILHNLNEPLTSGKRMPPLPVKVNDDLASFILPPLSSLGRQ